MAAIQNIRTYTRQLTRSPSEAQLTSVNLDFAINTVYQNDFPNDLKLINLENNLEWTCQPGVDRYELSALPIPGGVLDAKDYSIMLDNPAYIAGIPAYISQNQSEFYSLYPKINTITSIGTGNGTIATYTGTLGTYVLKRELVFTSADANNNALVVADDGAGTLAGDGTGTIDYFTGDFSVTFNPTVPGAAKDVYAQYVQTPLSQPYTILYFSNSFILRPVPDKAYVISIQVYEQPTALSDAQQDLVLNQWWQLIALMAARFVLNTRSDNDTIAQIMPELERQRSLALSNTVNNITKQRAPTIYQEDRPSRFLGSSWNNY